jgi:hypothetical protein
MPKSKPPPEVMLRGTSTEELPLMNGAFRDIVPVDGMDRIEWEPVKAEPEVIATLPEPVLVPTVEADDPEIRVALTIAINEQGVARDRFRESVTRWAAKDKAAKYAKKYMETCQDLLNASVDAIYDLRNGPDLPLFPKKKTDREKTKDELAATFPAPEAIQPLPPWDFPEFLRREQDKAPISALGLPRGIEKVFEELQLDTIGKIRRKFDAVYEGGASLTTIKGITAARLEKITEALSGFTDRCQVEWNAAHPEIVGTVEATLAVLAKEEAEQGEDFSIPEFMACNSCGWTKRHGDPAPCPNGHLGGFGRGTLAGFNDSGE